MGPPQWPCNGMTKLKRMGGGASIKSKTMKETKRINVVESRKTKMALLNFKARNFLGIPLRIPLNTLL